MMKFSIGSLTHASTMMHDEYAGHLKQYLARTCELLRKYGFLSELLSYCSTCSCANFLSVRSGGPTCSRKDSATSMFLNYDRARSSISQFCYRIRAMCLIVSIMRNCPLWRVPNSLSQQPSPPSYAVPTSTYYLTPS